jgi:hypothetical protein
LVEEEDVGPAGRKVRCSACAEEWRAHRDTGAPAEPDEPEPMAPPLAPLPDPPDAPGLETAALEPAADPPPEAETKQPAEETALFAPIATSRARRPPIGARTAFGVALIVIAILLAAAFFLREPVVRLFPGARGAYAAFGVSVPGEPSQATHD